jgi:hypothetical protein
VLKKQNKNTNTHTHTHTHTQSLTLSLFFSLCEDEEATRAICKAYGDHLLRSSPSEAAILYQRAGDTKAMLEAYQISLNWRLCLATAEQLGMDADALTELYEDMVERLVDVSRPVEVGLQ